MIAIAEERHRKNKALKQLPAKDLHFMVGITVAAFSTSASEFRHKLVIVFNCVKNCTPAFPGVIYVSNEMVQLYILIRKINVKIMLCLP